MHRTDFDDDAGLTAVRVVIAEAAARVAGLTADGAIDIACRRWGPTSRPAQALIQKGAVSGGGTLTGEWGAELLFENNEVIRATNAMTALFSLPLRYVPARVPFVRQTAAATAAWRGEGAALRVSSAAFDRSSLAPLTVGTVVVMSNELIDNTSPAAEAEIRRNLFVAAADAIETAAWDSTSTGSAGVQPQSLTNAGLTFSSSNDFNSDWQEAAALYTGDWRTARIVMSPTLAGQLALAYGDRGIGADAGPLGGRVLGIPMLTSAGFAADSSGVSDWALIDATQVAVVDQGIELKVSRQSTLELDDDPAQESLGPTAATGARVSMFVTENSAIAVLRKLNWELQSAGACVTCTSASYVSAS